MEVSSQIFDNSGKTRIIIFDSGMSMITHPLPPLTCPESTTQPTPVHVRTVVDAHNKKTLDIISQEGDESTISLVKVRIGYLTGHILVENHRPLENVPFSSDYISLSDCFINFDDETLDKASDISTLIQNIKTAKILKMLYSKDPTVNITVSTNWKYDLSDQTTFFDKTGRLVVHSSDILEKLKKTTKPIAPVMKRYELITDFTRRPRQILLSGKDQLIKWTYNRHQFKNQEIIQSSLNPTYEQPYLYEFMINGEQRIYMIQNVDGGEPKRACNVLKIWTEKSKNIGYFSAPMERFKTTLYLEDRGFVSIVDDEYKGFLLKYKKKRYAAVLELSTDKTYFREFRIT